MARTSHSCSMLLIVSLRGDKMMLVCPIIGGTKFDHLVKVVLVLVAVYRWTSPVLVFKLIVSDPYIFNWVNHVPSYGPRDFFPSSS